MILHPHLRVADSAFKPEYDAIRWETGTAADTAFEAWCNGQTCYPLIDAAVARLNRTGYLHNRLRMAAASFLVKDLGIDWRRGEQYFARQLNNYDLAAKNGGWQWGPRPDAMRNPISGYSTLVAQSRKFDLEGKFIRRYLPQPAKLSERDIHAPWLASPVALESAGLVLGTIILHRRCSTNWRASER